MHVVAVSMEVLFFIVVGYFALYVLLELRMVLLSRRSGTCERSGRPERRKLSAAAPEPADANFLPPVCVLLPICNESSVIAALIATACALRYPEGKLEILVLDDSTNAASDQAVSLVNAFAAKGRPVRYLHRGTRDGFKAQNLSYGLAHSRAGFIAIFDADFLPPEDFLIKTLPYFSNPRLGYLQTGIDYVNRDASFLTQYQAVGMRHQQYVTVGLRSEGNMASLSGTSCVWRRACLESVGGWNATTATEDVDAGYSAQFNNWDYAYLKDVVSLSMLPETVSAFRLQRERWGRGLIHNAFKHGGKIFSSSMSTMKRLYAISMMFSSLLLAAVYCLFLLTLPLAGLVRPEEKGFTGVALLFFLLAALWGAGNISNARMWDAMAKGGGLLKKALVLYAYIAMTLPLALYYFLGGVRVLLGQGGEFHTTPKSFDEHTAQKPKIDFLLLCGEIFSFFYSLTAIVISLSSGYYTLLPFNLTACFAFGMILYLEWQESSNKHSKATKKT